MEHKQFTSDNLRDDSPHSNHGFQADRFLKKTTQLNIPDTIPENSAEITGDSLKMEAPKTILQCISEEGKENISSNQSVLCNESLNTSTVFAIDNSYIKQCEKKLLENSCSDDERSIQNNSLVDKNILKVPRMSAYLNETISTPPSALRKEISLLRSEMAEAHEFHDLEIQLLKEEKCQNDVNSYNYSEIISKMTEKYSALMDLYTNLKTEYEDYRNKQEQMGQEIQSKTADYLESICSQIEASDNSLNYSSASFVSFNGGIKSSTMLEDIDEVEATVLHDATVLANDPLSITNDGMFKTPLNSAKKLFPQGLNSTIGKPIMKEVKEIIAKRDTTIPLDSEYSMQLLNVETALCDKIKEMEDLEQRLFKIEDMSSVLQSEIERITSQNSALKENLSKKTDQLNELTQKLFTETISLNPSLRESLLDIPGTNLLVVFIETIMESCKKIQSEEITKHNIEKAEWEAKTKVDSTTIENLQNQLLKIDELKNFCQDLEKKLSEAENTILTRDEEILMLQSHVLNVRQTREDFASAKETLLELETKLTLTEAEKTAAENRYREMETIIEGFKQQIETNKNIQTKLEEENSQMKNVKESQDALITQLESELSAIKENLKLGEEEIEKLKSGIQLIESEKSDLEKRVVELENRNQNLQNEIEISKNQINTENENLKQRILESEKISEELKTELDIAKSDEIKNISKIEDLFTEIEQLKKRNSEILEAVEETQKKLSDLLSDSENSESLPSERITELIESTTKFQETKIVSVFVETITKTCKGVQNELLNKFDSQKLDWETQKEIDLRKLQDEIISLIQSSNQKEEKINEMNLEKEDLLKAEENLKNKMTEAEKIISDYNEEIKTREAAIKQAENELVAAEETIVGLKTQLSLIQNEKEEIEIRCRQLEEGAQGEIKVIMTELDESKRIQRDTAENENSDLKQQMLTLEESAARLEESLREAKEEQSSKETKIQELQQEFDSLKHQQEDLIRGSETLEKNNKTLMEVLTDLQSSLDIPKDILTEFLMGDFENKKVFTDTVNNLIKTQMDDLKALNEILTEEKRQHDELKVKCEEELKKAQDLIKIREDEIQVLHSEIEKTKTELESQMSFIESEKKEIETKFHELEETVKKLKQELDMNEKQLTELHSMVEEKKIENLLLEEELKAKFNEEILITKEKELKLCENLENKVADAEKIIAAREEEIQNLRSDMKQIQEQRENTKNQLESTENQRQELEKIIEMLKQEIEVKENLQTEVTTQKSEIVHLKESYDHLKVQMTEAENLISTREEEIQNLRRDMKQIQEQLEDTKNQLESAENQRQELEKIIEMLKQEIEMKENLQAEVTTQMTEAEKLVLTREEEIQNLRRDMKQMQEQHEDTKNQLESAENQRQELEKIIEMLKQEIEMKENLQAEVTTQKSEIVHLKESYDHLKVQMTEAENLISTKEEEIRVLKSYQTELKAVKENLESADETIVLLKTQLKSIEVEKSEMENRCTELQINNKNLENYEKIQTENDDLKNRIFESEKMMIDLKNELDIAKEDQKKNIYKVEELIREIEELKKENNDFSHALFTIEETQKNLADVLWEDANDSDLPGDRITKLITKNKKPDDRKIVSDFVETISKTCKGVQNELIRKFDNKKIEWETQKDEDLQNLQDQIKILTEAKTQHEVLLTQTKDELALADEMILKLKSQLSLAQTEKGETEIKCQKLEEGLKAEIDTKETIIKGFDELKILREKVENENFCLKQQIEESEDVVVSLKKQLKTAEEEHNIKEAKIQDLLKEIESLKKEKDCLSFVTEKLEKLEKNNRNLIEILSGVQTHLEIPEDTLMNLLSGDYENKKIFIEKINAFAKAQMQDLKAENKNLKIGNENLKEEIKQLTKLIGETASNELKDQLANLKNSQLNSMNLRSKSSKNIDLCVRRLDKLEDINHNLSELLTRILTMTEFPNLEKIKLCSVREFPSASKKIVAHVNELLGKIKEMKEENSQLDEECETYANIIKDLKKEAAAVWKDNKEKTEAMEGEIERLKEEKKSLEKEKEDLEGKISKLNDECLKLKSKSEANSGNLPHTCSCGNESKKINELKRAILVKEQKLLELQDLEAQTSSYKSQIEYLKTALEREKKKIGEEKEKNKKLQNELNEAMKHQKIENKKSDENQVLDELRMRGSISGGIVQEFVDKEKMRKLSKDIGILKELCRARYAEIKRLEAVNAALKNGTPKNSNQMDSPIRSRGYNTRSKNQVRDFWKTEISGKENSAV